jgi:hypothetical protein
VRKNKTKNKTKKFDLVLAAYIVDRIDEFYPILH